MSINNNYIPISEYYSNAVGQKIAENYDSYGVMPLSDPSSGNCGGISCQTCQNCEGASCQTCQYCEGGCSGSCQVPCSGTCKGSCKTECTGTCVGDCSGSCKGTCTDGCETYCANDCQTYCEYNQVYSKNAGKNNPGGKIFTWDSNVEEGKTIYLTATEWNRLASYIEAAMKYCATETKKITRVSPEDPIYASYYNSMNTGVNIISSSGEENKKADVDFIKASNINALKDGYNKAKILTTLPVNPTGKTGACCQLKEACMTKAEGRPSLQDCKNGEVCPQKPS